MEHLEYDKRLLDYYLKIGKITQKDYDTYLANLKDAKSQADIIDIDKFIEESEDDEK